MLVLTRRVGETIVIYTPAGEHIQDTIPRGQGQPGSGRTGAPEGVIILREELTEAAGWVNTR